MDKFKRQIDGACQDLSKCLKSCSRAQWESSMDLHIITIGNAIAAMAQLHRQTWTPLECLLAEPRVTAGNDQVCQDASSKAFRETQQ